MTTTMDARTDDLIRRLAAHLHQTEIPDIAPNGHEHEATFALLLEEWGREFCLGYDPYQIVEALARRAVECIMTEWRDIETAPKDGTWFLCFGDPYDSDYPSISACRWVSTIYEGWEMVNSTTKKLRTREDGYWDCEYLIPTHWMPQPKPPAD